MRLSKCNKLVSVFFNGSQMRHLIDADDEEGWVEVINETYLSNLAPVTMIESPNPAIELPDPELPDPIDLPTIKRYGKVVFKY